ncbi:hypothetical protein BT96DRAFT_995628 [Gymnopus androsaceus JB14]|uniref:F-box domain-containing protein n=1 Tax=Gymnopus androsaceus JB14 TaxID=1447944 RepID=A0A6A4HKT9_9AGAR|nr:hypothetical protein BT96DRAFT_995628 [Gymnopus androsaceus JB14]
MMQLPHELVDHILENLYRDNPTLLKCALVGQAWVRPSQRGIFRRIALELPSSQDDAADIDAYLKTNDQLCALFAEKPHLASYVRELSLRGFRRGNWQVEEVLLNAIATVIQHLSNVLYFDTWDNNSDVEPSPVPELDIEDTYANNHPVRSTQLDKMRFYGHSGVTPFFLAWFQHQSCPFDIHHLRVLHLEVSDSDTVVRILQYVGKNLSDLGLRVSALVFTHSPDSTLDYLKYTPNLRNLQFFNVISIPVIQSLFKPFLDPSVRIRFPLRHFTIVILKNATQWEWRSVDVLLAKPEFALLKTMNIEVSEDVPKMLDIRQQICKQMPFLEGSRKLVVRKPKYSDSDWLSTRYV